MATNNPTPLVYDDPSLACIVQLVTFSVPWVSQPTNIEFPVIDMPRMEVPTMARILQDTEENWRKKIIEHLNNLLGEPHNASIASLPGSFMQGVIANIFYNTNGFFVDGIFPTRIGEEFSGSPYGVAPCWVGYYLADLLIAETSANPKKDSEDDFFIKQLFDLRRILSYVIADTLKEFPTLVRKNKVIIGATSTTETRATLYVDDVNFKKYLDSGKTVAELCVNFVNNKTNPTV